MMEIKQQARASCFFFFFLPDVETGKVRVEQKTMNPGFMASMLPLLLLLYCGKRESSLFGVRAYVRA